MGRWKKKKFERFIQEDLEILDAGSEGKAVARIGDLVVFVPYAVPGDVADVEVLSKKKKFAEGRIVRIKKPSSLRIEPKCVHFGLCGGCKWQNMEYASQLYFKQKQVKDNFDRIGKFEYPELPPILASGNIFQYRNKLEFTFSNRKWLTGPFTPGQTEQNMDGLGFHLPGMFDRILDLQECHLQPEPSEEIRSAIRDYALKQKLTFYDVRTGEGLLRNLLVRNTRSGELMVIMVFSKDEEEPIQGLMSFIRDSFPQLTSLVYVINPKRNDTINDLEIKLFHGRDHMIEEMPAFVKNSEPLKFKIGPVSFFQTNARQAERLYRVAAEFADFKGNETVYDLYTGTGTIACYIASSAKRVIGIDYIDSAIENARENAMLNGFKNLEFHTGDMAKVLTEDFIRENGRPDIIITDPPRAGMTEKVVMQILETAPEKIVYISCNPATQARDIALLSENYMVTAVQPVDMFPHTQHVECVVSLERRA
jgi:23S rRNA (uracil1939-C5)-methyltransferase